MAAEPEDTKFVSQLDDASKKKAKDELHEINDTDRILAVQTLRQWVLQQPWLRSPTDFGFLLRFLRTKKFSQLVARETLENYWTSRSASPEWFRDIDTRDPLIIEVLRAGMYVVPKKRDRHGRRIVFEKMPTMDPSVIKKKWGLDLIYKAVMLVFEWLIRDEAVQVDGIVMVIDNSDITWASLMALWDKDKEKKVMDFFQNALPARMKGLHMYNEPSFFDAMYALFSPLMKKKLRDRMVMHGKSLTKIYEDVGMEVMPIEYLPDDYEGPNTGHYDDMMEEMIADIQSDDFRNYIKELSSDKYGVDLSKRKKSDDAPSASFRKLNVD